MGLEEIQDFVKSYDNQELSMEDSCFLSLAFNNAIAARRASWKYLSSIENKENTTVNHLYSKRIRRYLEKIEKELDRICGNILELINDYLMSFASSQELKFFYLKLKGDYHRYIAEYKSGTAKRNAIE